MNNKASNVMGLVYILLGIVLLVVVAGELVLRLALAAFALYVINQGLRMRGNTTIGGAATRFFFGGFRFR